ncbi:MAG TPA: alpha/beta fold hydrolase, partial [Solirubrobacterales bacterium]|nr:alpha/beta fold hydrolase [Solirubrobacterales bacterium]
MIAHGVGGTRDSGLLPFAEAFARAGLDALLFDYRGFGDSSGEPRQYAWPARHRQDYRAAVEFVRTLDGVDPERIVLWGTSWSGGHVVYVAADDPGIAAVISQVADLDGVRTMLRIGEYAGPAQQIRLTLTGFRDVLGRIRGREPVMLPIVGAPGELAAMSSEEAVPGYAAIAGSSWRNEVTARAVFAEWTNRATTRMGELRCPILVQIADRDSVVPPNAARAAAWRAKGRVEVREYPCAHFDIYQGEWRERAIRDQLHFLGRHLAAGTKAPVSTL